MAIRGVKMFSVIGPSDLVSHVSTTEEYDPIFADVKGALFHPANPRHPNTM